MSASRLILITLISYFLTQDIKAQKLFRNFKSTLCRAVYIVQVIGQCLHVYIGQVIDEFEHI